jgi:dihydroneopterin aldolase/2-amino-4-hydroxy-6-hydroxymethyldihydropteridine diphosphokinase
MNTDIASINIKGIETKAIIGCYDYERVKPQDLLIDVIAELYTHNWMKQDKLGTTVDYDEICDYIVSVVSNTEFLLLETLTQFVANGVVDKFPLIKNVEINVTKLAICGIKAREIKVGFKKLRQFKVALALGSNAEFLPQQQLITAIEILGEYVDNIEIGGFYETKPVGYLEQKNFYNTAITGYTTLKPEELLGKIKSIEKLMGKTEIVINGPRIIDIDLILIDNLIYQHNFLHIPHKNAHIRDFVIYPLADIAPSWVHPVLNKTIAQLATEIGESSIIIRTEYYKQ